MRQTAIENRVYCAHRSHEGAHHAGCHGKAPVSVRRQREWGDIIGKNFYCGFCGEEWVR